MTDEGLFPYVPEYITVHLGPPDSPAENVTVSFPEYIKNVASSEIYPTWPESAIRANILAQISFALNRVYTEYYRSRGYDFDITNSTAYDQSFVKGRDIYENISQIVDEIFNDYLSRRGAVEPLYASYCDGIEVSCPGLSQWGSVALAEQGYTPYQILTTYYGDDIDIVSDAPVQGLSESYPGRTLQLGSIGNDVFLTQVRLNRISRNYPAIPKIEVTDALFGPQTEEAVRKFQQIFSLTEDGIVGRATWYKIAQVYNSVKRLSDLNSEGIPVEEVTGIFEPLQIGDTGLKVRELQYFLDFISEFNNAIPPTTVDGIFGQNTKNAVESYQQEYGLEVTGIADVATLESIYNNYRGFVASLPEDYFSAITQLYPGFPIVRGYEGDPVTAIQEYLNYISNDIPQIPKVTVDGIFGPATEDAVRTYQEIFGLAPTGMVSATTWNSITSTYRSLYESRQGQSTQYGGDVGNNSSQNPQSPQ